ncbi:MAG TPA: D-cysteine desulfhydrase family protein [candidate division Zixibacteria bacterium]|nr:D-cysteine desulfhydrase family protein [candidate division Zixibacteria bacterium]
MMQPAYPERIKLAHLPTQLQKLTRLSEYLGGPQLLMKRDDQTGLALGGNKTRKLEFLVADALEKGCDYLVTTGAPQSNHCRQTAAAAAATGLGCSLVLRGHPSPDHSGNLLLDLFLGANLHWCGDSTTDDVLPEVAAELEAAGHKPYPIPLGGSNVLGAASYVLAMGELMDQLKAMEIEVDAMVVASSSGGTQAGMALGALAYDFEGTVVGISIDHPASVLNSMVSSLATATAMHLTIALPSNGPEIVVEDGYLGEGYGIVGDLEREAINLLAKYQGILLDPVYTGRAMGGLIDLIRQGRYGTEQKILFWHTGGTPALFAYGAELT